jgi:putative phosphoesterase
MKIAALADIHGNYQALVTAIDLVQRWKPDLVFVLGDIINRGPRSRDCLQLVQDLQSTQDWKVIKGNHEGYVLEFEDPNTPRRGIDFELHRVIFWTYQSLSKKEIQSIDHLPIRFEYRLTPNQLLIGLHASTAGDRVGIYPNTSLSDLEDLIDNQADIFLVGHTHQPFIKDLKGTKVINVGSVGLPFDGDKRGSYAKITYSNKQYQSEIVRFEYDLSMAARDFKISGFLSEGGPLAELILAELKLGWPQINHWFRKYDDLVRQGQISIQQAVNQYLQDPNIEGRR